MQTIEVSDIIMGTHPQLKESGRVIETNLESVLDRKDRPRYMVDSLVLSHLSDEDEFKVRKVMDLLGRNSKSGFAYHTDAHPPTMQESLAHLYEENGLIVPSLEMARQMMTIQFHDADSLERGVKNDNMFPLNEDKASLDLFTYYNHPENFTAYDAFHGFMTVQATKANPFLPKFQNVDKSMRAYEEVVNLLLNYDNLSSRAVRFFNKRKNDLGLEQRIKNVILSVLDDPKKTSKEEAEEISSRIAKVLYSERKEIKREIQRRVLDRNFSSVQEFLAQEREYSMQVADIDIFNSATQDFFFYNFLMKMEAKNHQKFQWNPRDAFRQEFNIFLNSVIKDPFYSKLASPYQKGKEMNMLNLYQFLSGRRLVPQQEVFINPKIGSLTVPEDFPESKELSKFDIYRAFSTKEWTGHNLLETLFNESWERLFADRIADFAKHKDFFTRLELLRTAFNYDNVTELKTKQEGDKFWLEPIILANGRYKHAKGDSFETVEKSHEEIPLDSFYELLLKEIINLKIVNRKDLDSVQRDNISKLETFVTGVYHNQRTTTGIYKSYETKRVVSYFGESVLNNLGRLNGIDFMAGFNVMKEGGNLRELAEKLSDLTPEEIKLGINPFFVNSQSSLSIFQRYVSNGEDGSIQGYGYNVAKKDLFSNTSQNKRKSFTLNKENLRQGIKSEGLVDDLTFANTLHKYYTEQANSVNYINAIIALERFIEFETLSRNNLTEADIVKEKPISYSSERLQAIRRIHDNIKPKTNSWSNRVESSYLGRLEAIRRARENYLKSK